MAWLERKIRRYEHMRWAQEPNRRTLPFAWGLEHIGGTSNEPDPRRYLDRFVEHTLAHSDAWYATGPAEDYSLIDDVLTFSSAVQSPWPENNRVHAQFFQARHTGPAVVALAQWNSRWEEQTHVCRWLNKLGITAVKTSLPYHDRRAVPGHPRADHLVGPNVGLTLQANRQAVLDVRRTLRWLEQRGYDRLGVLGTSIGSSIAFVTMCHEPAIRAGAFLHVATYCGDGAARFLIFQSSTALGRKFSPSRVGTIRLFGRNSPMLFSTRFPEVAWKWRGCPCHAATIPWELCRSSGRLEPALVGSCFNLWHRNWSAQNKTSQIVLGVLFAVAD